MPQPIIVLGAWSRRADVGHLGRARRRPRRVHGGDAGAARVRNDAGRGRGCGLTNGKVAFIGSDDGPRHGRSLSRGRLHVAVWNRSRSKADDLIARGARWAAFLLMRPTEPTQL